jgi:hypothetical protein
MKPGLKRIHKVWLWAILALILAASLKTSLVMAGRVPFNADEAIVALMARHILQGARPIFFYGQAYMGSLDAFLVAGAFALFGQQVWVIRLVQGIIYLGVLATTGWLGPKAFGSVWVGILAMLLLAIPTINVTLYTTASLGGYGEALLLGNLSLLVGLKIADHLRSMGDAGGLVWWLLLGVLAGLGLWAFGLALVFCVPVGAGLLFLSLQPAGASPEQASAAPAARLDPGAQVEWPSRLSFFWRRTGVAWLTLFAGGLLGASPWVIYALQHGLGGLLFELGGGAIAGVEGLPWMLQVGKHLAGFLLLGVTVTLGLRPPWGVEWLGLPLIPFVLFFWVAVLISTFRRLRQPGPYRFAQVILAGVILALLAGFIFTPFGADPSGRYFVPLAVPMALFAAAAIQHWQARLGFWSYALVALLMIHSLWGTLQTALRFPPGVTTQFYGPSQVDMRDLDDLAAFLRLQGETRGYSNYWVAYPLAFQSSETLIFTPRLPYHLDFRHTERDNRYAPYNEVVAQAARVAYVTTNHPDLDQYLRDQFTGQGVTWLETRLGDFQVFYHLSQVIRPEQIGLGQNTP